MTNPYAPPRDHTEVEVRGTAEQVPQPRFLREFLFLMLAFSAAYFVAEVLGQDTAGLLYEVGVVVPPLFIYWFLWKGNRWARRLVLLGSALGPVSYLMLSEFNWLERIVLFAETPFNLYLLYWLNTREVKEYFGAQVPEKRAS